MMRVDVTRVHAVDFVGGRVPRPAKGSGRQAGVSTIAGAVMSEANHYGP